MVISQSQSPQFQVLLERLTGVYGCCTLLTGTPYPTSCSLMKPVVGPTYRRASLQSRAASWLCFTWFALVRLLFCHPPRVLFVTTNPPFLPHLCWLAGRLRRVRYVLLFWDIYPDHAVRQGWLSESGVMARTWRRANRRALRGASAVITIGEGMASTLQQQAGDIHIDVIPSWADTEVIRPIPKGCNPFAGEHGQVGKLTVIYSGNVGKTHGVETLVDAAATLRDLVNTWVLVIGDGLGLDDARRRATELSVSNISFFPLQPWARVPLSLATGDIAVVLQAPGTEHLSVPSKTYSLMAAGCAIVACTTSGSDLAALVTRHNIGLVVPPQDAGALAGALRRLILDPVLLGAMRERARTTAVESYSLPVVQASFEGVFKRCLEKMEP
jgi:glycosyltransferase involved in cell wall biosynthesis